MKQNVRKFFLTLLAVSSVSSILENDFEKFNCAELVPLLQKDYYADSLLVTHLVDQNDKINKLNKYIGYAINRVNKEFKRKCKRFSGYIKEQIAYCADTELFPSCSRRHMVNGSGVYRLSPKSNDASEAYFTYCLECDEGGEPWTVIQRRMSSAIKFDRSWDEYENGFGNIYESYWLGLRNIYEIMNGTSYELWIQLEDFENVTHSAKYGEFVLGDAKSGYALLFLDAYRGTAGNALRDSIGSRFAPQDIGKTKCSDYTNGIWWYSDCGTSNLNGEYFAEVTPPEKRKGIFWNSWKGLEYSYKYVHMAIREKVLT